jgi:hypothetical protein
MYINITDSETADNKGSSGNLVHYLDKENRSDLEKTPEFWFNGQHNNISSHEAKQALDWNIAKLSKTDAKFFLVNISPSQKEIAFLKEKYGEHGVKEQLKAYAASVMDEYALNFKRPGIESNKDLLWFGKLENHRYYTHKDPEVKQGIKKRGERKPGEQMHIQVVVSRKDITNKIKLSPMNKSRGKNNEHSKKMGQFDRSAFKSSGERIFDEKFSFERGFTETFKYVNAQKKGNLEQRMAVHAGQYNQQSEQKAHSSEKRQQTKVKNSAISQRSGKSNLKSPENGQFLKLALDKYSPDVAFNTPRKKKRRKANDQQQARDVTL